jgi:tetraacyldisaccharide 4'-kinase
MLKLIGAPIAIVYGLVVKIRNLLFDLRLLPSVRVSKATICVGNLTVGGTGKTPHIEYLIRLLSPKMKLATLSRGYKRKAKGFRYVDANSTEEEVGDEPMQIKLKFPNIIVAVDGNRVRGANKLIHDHPDLKMILLDDAFQHRYLQSGYSILLTDYNNLVTSDYFLPVGRLRDSLSELRRADCVIVTKCPQNFKPIDQRIVIKELSLYPFQTIFFTSLSYGDPLPVFPNIGDEVRFNSNTTILAMGGIANPVLFYEHLNNSYNVVDRITFSDHYRYTDKKIKAIFEKFSKIDVENKAILTTEKDAARIRSVEGIVQETMRAFYYIPIEVVFRNNSQEEFNKQIESYVTKSKRDHSLYSKQS